MSVTVSEEFHFPRMKVSYFIHLFARRLSPGIAHKVANAKTEILHTLIPTLSSILPHRCGKTEARGSMLVPRDSCKMCKNEN